MRIAIDARAYFQRTGIARYTRELLSGLASAKGDHELLCLISDQHTPAEVPLADERVEVRVSRAPWLGGAAERHQLEREVADWRADLFHGVFPPLALCAAPSITTVLDVTPLTHPHLHQPVVVQRFRQLQSVLLEATQIVVPSQATAAAVHRLFAVDPASIQVVPCGLASIFSGDPGQRTRSGVLYVGTIEPRKNLPLLCEAMRRLHRSGRGLRLTVVGKPGWGERSVADLTAGLHDTCYRGYLDDRQLAEEYRRHTIFAYLSEAEGFGFPVLEAMSLGALPIVSRDPALRELVDEPDLSVDERDPDRVADAVAYWHGQPTRRAAVCQRLVDRARTFTWARSAEMMVDLYRRAA